MKNNIWNDCYNSKYISYSSNIHTSMYITTSVSNFVSFLIGIFQIYTKNLKNYYLLYLITDNLYLNKAKVIEKFWYEFRVPELRNFL